MNDPKQNEGSLLRTTLTIKSINIEGISVSKKALLETMWHKHNCDVLGIQDTHRDPTQRKPKIQSMRLAIEKIP